MADSEARASVFMNRRIRNRTSGGVGGRRGWKHPRLLPDVAPGAWLVVAVVRRSEADPNSESPDESGPPA